MGILIAILTSLFLAEFYVWLPRGCTLIVQLAINLLPSEQRERWQEEFTESQNALPPSVWKLADAISLCFFALGIARRAATVEIEELFSQVEDGIELLQTAHGRGESKLQALAVSIAAGRSQRVPVPGLLLGKGIRNDILASAVTQRVATLGAHAERINDAHDRVLTEYAATVDLISKEWNNAAHFMKRFEIEWHLARKLWSIVRRLPFFGPLVLSWALSVVSRDFWRLNSCLESSLLLIEQQKLFKDLETAAQAHRQATAIVSPILTSDSSHATPANPDGSA
jgi:hypothetical protein